MNIVQLVPALHTGDAIGNNALALRDHFRASGVDSAIISLQADPEVAGESVAIQCFPELDSPDAVIILHYALPSPLNDLFRNAAGRKILVYHNITPPEFLAGYPHLQQIARAGREALRSLQGVPDLTVADSGFNRMELDEMGFRESREIPIFLDMAKYRLPGNPVIPRMFDDDFTTLLYVGRVTPNKCQDDLIRFFAVYKRYVRRRSRLFIVGKWDGFGNYFMTLNDLVERLGLSDVHFTGRVNDDELRSYYRMADLFVSMSEHEGFGVPLVESMIFDIPVLARAAAAVPFTMGDAGVLFHSRERFTELAELAGEIIENPVLRESILIRQRDRLGYFSPSRIAGLWSDAIAGLPRG